MSLESALCELHGQPYNDKPMTRFALSRDMNNSDEYTMKMHRKEGTPS